MCQCVKYHTVQTWGSEWAQAACLTVRLVCIQCRHRTPESLRTPDTHELPSRYVPLCTATNSTGQCPLVVNTTLSTSIRSTVNFQPTLHHQHQLTHLPVHFYRLLAVHRQLVDSLGISASHNIIYGFYHYFYLSGTLAPFRQYFLTFTYHLSASKLLTGCRPGRGKPPPAIPVTFMVPTWHNLQEGASLHQQSQWPSRYLPGVTCRKGPASTSNPNDLQGTGTYLA